jgi:hypothetical protein
MSSRNTNDPKHWHDRAAQMRAVALTMDDPEGVILMTDLAADYEKFAEEVASVAPAESQRVKASVQRPSN